MSAVCVNGIFNESVLIPIPCVFCKEFDDFLRTQMQRIEGHRVQQLPLWSLMKGADVVSKPRLCLKKVFREKALNGLNGSAIQCCTNWHRYFPSLAAMHFAPGFFLETSSFLSRVL